MRILKLWLPIIFILIGFNGCGEVEEKKSNPKILLNEKENELPKSDLKKPDNSLEKILLSKLPEVKSFSKLTNKINKTKNTFWYCTSW